MNWLDFVFIAILLMSIVTSARKGFSREIIGLAAMFLALLLGMWFYGMAGSFLIPYVSSTRLANLIGFLLVVFGVILCGSLLGWIVSRFLRTIGLSFFDRFLGAVFGVARGLLLAIALLTGFMAFGSQVDSRTVGTAPVKGTLESSVLNSRIAPYVLKASRVFVALAPMELKSAFQRQYARLASVLAANAAPSDRNRPNTR